MSDVFISYKSERRRAAQHLADILRAYGFAVWFDYDLVAGSNFGRQIERELRAATAVLVLWCTRSIDSEWVHEEAALAKSLGTFIPIKIEPCEPPLGYRLDQFVDISAWDGDPGTRALDQLIEQIEAMVGREAAITRKALTELHQTWSRDPRSLAAFELVASKFVGVEEPRLSVASLPPPQLAMPAIVQGEPTVEPQRELRPGDVLRDRIKTDDSSYDGPAMVVIPAGRFWMGSPESEENRGPYEGPQFAVSIAKSFLVGTYPVTFAEWDAAQLHPHWRSITGLAPRLPRDYGWGRGPRPVVDVDWDDARLFAKWLSDVTGHSYRLVSEAEWEYACRAGTDTPYAVQIGKDPVTYGATVVTKYDLRYDAVVQRSTGPVGEFPSNAFGLHDMHGNVWEWCMDSFNNVTGYDGTTSDGAARQEAVTIYRSKRGGSWKLSAPYARSANRSRAIVKTRDDETGFRVARDL